jgi:hypothetical protein
MEQHLNIQRKIAWLRLLCEVCLPMNISLRALSDNYS